MLTDQEGFLNILEDAFFVISHQLTLGWNSLLAFLHLYLVVLPQTLFSALRDYLLRSLPSAFTRCSSESCQLNDIGWAGLGVVVLLAAVWLVRRYGGGKPKEWLDQ